MLQPLAVVATTTEDEGSQPSSRRRQTTKGTKSGSAAAAAAASVAGGAEKGRRRRQEEKGRGGKLFHSVHKDPKAPLSSLLSPFFYFFLVWPSSLFATGAKPSRGWVGKVGEGDLSTQPWPSVGRCSKSF